MTVGTRTAEPAELAADLGRFLAILDVPAAPPAVTVRARATAIADIGAQKHLGERREVAAGGAAAAPRRGGVYARSRIGARDDVGVCAPVWHGG